MKKKETGSFKFAGILESLDREIQALRSARALLLEGEAGAPVKRGRGRPRKAQPLLPEMKIAGEAMPGRKRQA